jgi:hypothetical protein
MENKKLNLVNPLIGKKHIGYFVSFKDNSRKRAKGIEYDYEIILYKIKRNKFLFWTYKEYKEFDQFLFRPKQAFSKEKLEFQTEDFDKLYKFISNLGLSNGDRPAGYLIIPSGY